MPTSNSIDWQIESIRVTAFVNGQLNPGMLETWIGEVSENSPSRVSKTPSSFIAVSRSSAGFLRTNWNANRLDVTLSSEQPQSRQTIAPMSEATALFGRFVDRIPEIGELALVDRLAIIHHQLLDGRVFVLLGLILFVLGSVIRLRMP